MKPYVVCFCKDCIRLERSRLQNQAAEAVKTQLDLEPPRFDVGGNRITGELDNEKTPDSGISIPIIEIEEAEPDTFSSVGGYFVFGVGLGMLLFMLGWVSCLIAGGK